MTNKLKYFIGNWKMYGNLSSINLLKKVENFVKKHNKKNNSKIIFCIPNTLIDHFSKKLRVSKISIGAQNCHHKETYGAYTGSVSPLMLKKAGAKYVILGHAECRMNGESINLIKEKVFSALSQKLKVILCFGETNKDKKKNKTFFVFKKQLNFLNDKKINFKNLILAYEPVWAIGSGKVPSINDVKSSIGLIRKILKKKIKNNKIPKILYGGSVNKEIAKKFTEIDSLDGFLIGGASQSPKNFIDIIKYYYK